MIFVKDNAAHQSMSHASKKNQSIHLPKYFQVALKTIGK